MSSRTFHSTSHSKRNKKKKTYSVKTCTADFWFKNSKFDYARVESSKIITEQKKKYPQCLCICKIMNKKKLQLPARYFLSLCNLCASYKFPNDVASYKNTYAKLYNAPFNFDCITNWINANWMTHSIRRNWQQLCNHF